MNVFYALAIFFLFFVLLYGSYARFAWTIQRWVKKPRKSRKTHKMVQPKLKKKELKMKKNLLEGSDDSDDAVTINIVRASKKGVETSEEIRK